MINRIPGYIRGVVQVDTTGWQRIYAENNDDLSTTVQDSSDVPVDVAPGTSTRVSDTFFDRDVRSFSTQTSGVALGDAIDTSEGFTIAMWVLALNTDWFRVLTINPNQQMMVQFQTLANEVYLATGNITRSYPASYNQWRHFAVRVQLNGTTRSVDHFVDGVNVGTVSGITATNLGLGTSYWGTSRSNNNGLIGRSVDLIVAPVLSDAVIQTLANPTTYLG